MHESMYVFQRRKATMLFGDLDVNDFKFQVIGSMQ